MANQIKKKYILDNAVDGEKIQLLNEQALRAKKQGGADQDIFKLDSADKLKFQLKPRYDALPGAFSDADELVNKAYVDAEIAGAGGDISALETRVQNIEDDYGAANGLATLGGDGKIPSAQLPAIAITDVHVVADIAARDLLTVEEGDVAKVSDAGAGLPRTYIYDGSVWIEIESGSDVDSVNGYTGVVVLDTEDVLESGDSRYYTAARQSSMEAYADQAEADAITSANSYTDAEVALLEAEDLTLLKLDGSRAMTGALDMGTHAITNVVDPTNAQDAATKAYVDSVAAGIDTAAEISFAPAGNIAATNVQAAIEELEADYEAEDLTFLKLDGSRSMSNPLYMGGFGIEEVSSITGTTTLTLTANSGLLLLQGNQSIKLSPAVAVDVDTHKIVNLVDGTAATDAVNFGQLESLETALEAEDLTFLKLDGTRPMEADLDMDSNGISGVGVVQGTGSASISYSAGLAGNSLNLQGADVEVTTTVGGIGLNSFQGINLNPSPGFEIDAQAVINMNSHVIKGVTDGVNNDEAVNKGQLDALGVSITGAYQAEDLTFLKLDGSRAMTDSLDMGGFTVTDTAGLTGEALTLTATVGAVIISGATNASLAAGASSEVQLSQGSKTARFTETSFDLDEVGIIKFGGASAINSFNISTENGDAMLSTNGPTGGNVQLESELADVVLLAPAGEVSIGATQLNMGSVKIVSLANGTAADDAATVGQVDAIEVAYTSQKFTLTATDISNGYIDLNHSIIDESLNAYVDRLAIHKTDDYTLSVVGGVTRLTFAGNLISPSEEQVAENDVVHVKYAYLANA